MSRTRTVILHMTDLHFGCDGENTNSLNSRQLALDGLVRAITRLDPDWRPTIVAVTGDLAWRGKSPEYDKFGAWFGALLEAIGVAPDRCFFCPGNHDVDRSIARTIARPRDAAEADEVLGIPLASQYMNAFRSFSEFSQRFGIPPYQLGADVSHLVGLRRLDGMSFVAMNSSWFCKDKDDQGNLWLGLPILKELVAHKQLPNDTERRDGGPIIAIFHHPREWFNASEITTYGSRTNPFAYLARRCDLMLTGHTHGEVGRAELIEESAWHLRTGASYVDENYVNAFTLVRVDESDCAYVSYEYDSRSANHEWRQVSDGVRGLAYHRGRIVGGGGGGVDPGQGVDLRAYREKTQQYARAFAELKSRVIRPHGILPSLISLGVVPSRRICNSDNPPKEPEGTPRPISLFEAVRSARATLLLGDLGTGKSTLAAGLVKQTHDANPFALSVLVPAKSVIAALQGSGTGNSEPTIRQLLRGLSNFIGDHVAPSIPKRLEIEATLNEKVEVSILVDGLDEVSASSASLMLRLLLALTDHWPNVQVLATGRPVELSGVPYENWQIFSTVPLQDQERRALFAEEARADGLSERDALDRSFSLLAKLRHMPEVYSLANTPLMIRLLNSHLASMSNGAAITTGDLLFEVLKERLGAWESRDAKNPVGTAFAAHCPDSAARMELLGKIAISIYPRQSLSVEEFHHKLQGLISVSNSGSIASEALTYFTQTGVLVQTADIEFPLRPLLEFLYGYAVALHIDSVTPKDLTCWRPLSYAATTIRRLGLGARAKAAVSGYVQRLVVEAGEVLAAAFIVTELLEGGVAEEFVKALPVKGRKPLFSRSGSGVVWTQAARAFAGSLKLAGKAGFEWFFEEYLDPRYPFLSVGSMAVADVFKEWAAMSIDTLSAHERQQLALILPPHIAADSNELHGIVSRIAVLMPDLFDTQLRVWFCAMNLAEEAFAERAKQIIWAASESEPNTVRSTLEFCVNTGFANHAAPLCIDLFPANPALSVIRGLVRLEAGEADSNFEAKTLLPSIGAPEWCRLLSWYVFDVDSVLAARAAIKLYRLGETRVTFIGPALLRGMHDGGYVKGTEEALKDLVERQGEWAVRWLGDWISRAAEDMHGAHSAWWRIFLQQLTSLSVDAAAILADSVSGLGCFVLARNPEIRQKFVQLLTGRDGIHFQSALRARLTHPSIAVRHGAAMILLLANPKTEAEALEVVVRAKSARHSGAWHEWERFCLTLQFGASSLAALQRHLGELAEPSAAFALAILNRNGVKLSTGQKEQLLRGRMQYFIEDEQKVADAASVEALLRVVRSGASAERLVKQAAAILLEEHMDELAVPDRARCAIFADVRWPWPMSRERLEQEWSRAKADPVYAAALESAAHEAVDEGFQEPLLYLLVNSSPEDPLSMKEVLWALVGREQGFPDIHHWEYGGQWMLEFLGRHPEYRNATGTAAAELLDDPRARGGRFREPQHWLALLADECGAINRGRIEEVLRSYPIEKSATVALMARAGVPLNHFRRGSATLPANFVLPPTPAPLTTISGLVERVQEPGASSPLVTYQVEQCLADGLEIEEAGLEAIARQSNLGTLVASALRFVSGQKPSVTWLSKLLLWDVQFVPREPSLDRLIQIWRCCVEEGHIDPSWKNEYLGALTHLLNGEPAVALRAASDILALRGSLTAEEFQKTLNACTESRYFSDHSGLVPQLSKWLSSGVALDGESLEAVERGLTLLESAQEPVGNSIRPYPGPFLLLPLVLFIYAKRVDQKSCRVFMRGLRESLAPESAHQLPGIRPLIAVDPLLTQVSNDLLEQVFAFAEREDDPTIRVLGRVLRRVVKATTN